jgi:hypothetical protein
LKPCWCATVNMSRTHIKTLSLILILSVGGLQRVESQAKRAPSRSPCPDDRAWTGMYRNYVYGFSVVIPRGLKGYWNSARCARDEKYGCVCMGDHGRFIPLSTDASIEAFVGYQMEPEWSLDEHEHQAVSFLTDDKQNQQVHVVRSGWFRLGHLRARRFEVRFLKDNKPMITDHIIALHKGVEYELILRTLPERYRRDRIQFEKMIGSWRLASRV